MEKREDGLRVRLLGGFEMSYRGQEIPLGKKVTTKPFHLLQHLLYAGADGIARKELVKDLFGDDAEVNTKDNFGVTVWQLRKFLQGCGLPKEKYITVSGGIYRFVSSFPVEVDAVVMEQTYRKAEQETDMDVRLALLRKICGLYRGHFLPHLAGAEWVEVAGAYYKDIYFKSLQALCGMLQTGRAGEGTLRERNGRKTGGHRQIADEAGSEEILELCGRAAELYPYDEWQVWQIEALMVLGRYQEALTLYEETTSRYLDELGIYPSERMQEYFRKISDNLANRTEDIQEVLEKQRETEMTGAYYCAYPGFVDVYHVLERMVIRSGQSVYIMLCTVVDEEKEAVGNQDRQKKLAEKLEQVIQKTLRRGDVYTKYSQNQFLVLLVVPSQEDISKIISRLDNGFHRKINSRRVRVSYRTAPLSVREE